MLWNVVLQLEESGDCAPRFCGSARLGTCNFSSKWDLQTTPDAMSDLCGESLPAAVLHWINCLGEEALCAERNRTSWNPASMPFLAKWAGAALMVQLRGKFYQSTCFKFNWEKNTPARGLQRDERFSTSGLGWLQRCPVLMPLKTTNSRCRVPMVTFLLTEKHCTPQWENG